MLTHDNSSRSLPALPVRYFSLKKIPHLFGDDLWDQLQILRLPWHPPTGAPHVSVRESLSHP